MRSKKAMTASDSGSLPALGPDHLEPPRPCWSQAAGKLRFRSTPEAVARVFAAAPSGLMLLISQMAESAGSSFPLPNRRAISLVTRLPARSLPCIWPTTTTLVLANFDPYRVATMARPCPLVPITSLTPTSLERGNAAKGPQKPRITPSPTPKTSADRIVSV
ncbi:unannotated protein [freshwater metagenome]|uniref:Unannotated protein n=1 Tax=freshwater metagenome TaxID=449393 RepID=A0A6J6NGL5_9ZZZZ